MKLVPQIINLPQFTAQMEKLADAARGEPLSRAANAGGYELRGLVEVNIRKQDLVDTGNLVNSISVKSVQLVGSGAEAVVGTNVVYAAIHEFGGVINAKGPGGLVFQTEDGEWHHVSRVTIPARPYMRPAVDEGHQRVADAVAAVLSDYFNSLRISS